MAVGDITSTAVAYNSMAELEVALEAENTGAATAGADTVSFMIVPAGLKGFWLIKMTRAAA